MLQFENHCLRSVVLHQPESSVCVCVIIVNIHGASTVTSCCTKHDMWDISFHPYIHPFHRGWNGGTLEVSGVGGIQMQDLNPFALLPLKHQLPQECDLFCPGQSWFSGRNRTMVSPRGAILCVWFLDAWGGRRSQIRVPSNAMAWEGAEDMLGCKEKPGPQPYTHSFAFISGEPGIQNHHALLKHEKVLSIQLKKKGEGFRSWCLNSNLLTLPFIVCVSFLLLLNKISISFILLL